MYSLTGNNKIVPATRPSESFGTKRYLVAGIEPVIRAKTTSTYGTTPKTKFDKAV